MGYFFSKYKVYIFIVLGVGAAIAAWWMLADDSQSNSLLSGQGPAQQVALDGRDAEDIVGTLLQLRAVSLSGTIFADPAFARLQDFGTQIVPEPVGRPNPFLPFTVGPTTAVDADPDLFVP